jgi:hypothetical protein
MARTVASLPAGSRITDYISLGVIAKFFPAGVVSSRNRVNFRGVKRKTSSYNLRPRKRRRAHRIDVSEHIRIVK